MNTEEDICVMSANRLPVATRYGMSTVGSLNAVLVERLPVERGSAQRSPLKGREKATVNPINS